MKPLLKVYWNMKWRLRALGKTKFFNRVAWFFEDGKKPIEVRKYLYLEKIEPLRIRCNNEGIHGKKRRNMLNRKKYQIKEALRQSLGRKVYSSEFPPASEA
jgi:hypothetical protein